LTARALEARGGCTAQGLSNMPLADMNTPGIFEQCHDLVT
jgi:hypothetical protein